jgi:hypothetical protein
MVAKLSHILRPKRRLKIYLDLRKAKKSKLHSFVICSPYPAFIIGLNVQSMYAFKKQDAYSNLVGKFDGNKLLRSKSQRQY